MGLAKGALTALLKESARRRFAGSILTLGRQDVYFGEGTIAALARSTGARVIEAGPVLPAPKGDLAARGFVADTYLFRRLGFENCVSLDYSAFEHADYTHDLNLPETPEALVGQFDVVTDTGTLEHVFHLPNALQSICRMLKPSGRVIHISPSSNYVDHGFYMFSPTLFADYYAANGFQVNTLQLFRHTIRHDRDPWVVYEYDPQRMAALSYGALDASLYGTICVATKTPGAVGHNIPQQRYYAQQAWVGRAPEQGQVPLAGRVLGAMIARGLLPSALVLPRRVRLDLVLRRVGRY